MRNILRFALAGSAAGAMACGSGSPNGGFMLGGGDGGFRDGSMSISNGDTGGLGQGDGGTGHTGSGDSSVVCPPGLDCNPSCSGGGNTTTVTGRVYDPALRNALYNIAVYVPAVPLAPLPKGVATGADSCSCGSLFESGAVTNTTTTVDGTFKLTNVPVGSAVPLVIQIGKWRRQYMLNIKACEDNAQADKSIAFLGTVPASDTIDSMPDIAVSTGALDTLECLLVRVGVSKSEYVPGAATGGHVHIFSGGNDGSNSGAMTGNGAAENPPMAGAPTSWTALWDQQAHMMPYDVVLLSCEGDETYNSNPSVLEAYLNAGGRAFGSHYHYAWFAGSLMGENVPAAPSVWGQNLADWGAMLSTQTTGAADVVQTLGTGSSPFPKGIAMKEWLNVVGALGVEGAGGGQIPIFDENQDVGATKEAQAWLVDQGWTDYLSFNTPINAPNAPDGGPPQYCGRAVFADLHVDSDPSNMDTNPPPSGCADGDLSPQEKALEFMLFDLSSCVVPDTETVPLDAGLPPPPK